MNTTTKPNYQQPALIGGIVMGVLAKHGRDKMTIIASPKIGDIGAWLEQLLAESTGKHGKGLIPVADEPIVAPELYGRDRLFAYLQLEEGEDPAQQTPPEAHAEALIRLALPSCTMTGQWVAGDEALGG